MRPVEELKADETKIVPLSRVQGQDGVRLRIPVISAAKGKGEQPSVHTIDLQRLPVFALFVPGFPPSSLLGSSADEREGSTTQPGISSTVLPTRSLPLSARIPPSPK